MSPLLPFDQLSLPDIVAAGDEDDHFESDDSDDSDHEGDSVNLTFEEYLLAKRENFPIFFINLTDSLKTDTPDWSVIIYIYILHDMWCDYDNLEDDIIFWGISKESCKIFQEQRF
jgi:hypothetical protein